MRNTLTRKEKVNAKSGKSMKNLEFVNGIFTFPCIAIAVSKVEVDGKPTDNAIFVQADGTCINSISSTVLETVSDIMDLIDDGEFTDDEVIDITVTEKTSNAGRKFYMITI